MNVAISLIDNNLLGEVFNKHINNVLKNLPKILSLAATSYFLRRNPTATPPSSHLNMANWKEMFQVIKIYHWRLVTREICGYYIYMDSPLQYL